MKTRVIIVPDIIPTRLPAPPQRLIIALPSLLSSEGVRSGISATTGALQSDIVNTKRITVVIRRGRLPFERKTTGISAKISAETGASRKIKGLRFPNLE